MIRINLLPFRAARKKENVRRQLSVFVLSLVLLFLVLLGGLTWSNRKLEQTATRLEETKTEVDRLTKINEEIKKYKKEISDNEKKIKVINRLEANRTEPVKLIDAMTALIVPNRMWFTAFDAKGNSVDIKGIAVDNKTVADFMTRLENSTFFSAVNLATVKQEKIRNLDMKRFHITCTKVETK
jgi:type IV pilus assembly protein PilN